MKVHKDARDVRNRIRSAFAVLRSDGYFARMNFMCCQSCAGAEIPEEFTDKYAFYHNQDTEVLNQFGEVYIAYSPATGQHIKQRIEEAGLEVEWDGDPDRRILVRMPVKH